MKTVIVEHQYDASAARVWALAINLDALKTVMEGVVTFEGVPKGQIHAGQQMDVRVSLFGKLPWQPYYMEILECDDVIMTMRSAERGTGVKSWTHTLTVRETAEGGCTLRDHIEIDAGLLSFAFAAWARYLYKARHKPRCALLVTGAY